MWREEAEPEIASGIDGDVGGGDADGVDAFGGGRCCFEVYEVEETAVDGAVAAGAGGPDEMEHEQLESGQQWQRE